MNEGTRREFARKIADLIRSRGPHLGLDYVRPPFIYYPDDIDQISIELRVNRDEARQEFWHLDGTVWAVLDDEQGHYSEGGDWVASLRRSGYSHEDWERMRESSRYLLIENVTLMDDPDPRTWYQW
jgi:hypothetical protein